MTFWSVSERVGGPVSGSAGEVDQVEDRGFELGDPLATTVAGDKYLAFQCLTKDGSEVEGAFGASFGVSAVSFGETGGLGWFGVSDLVSHFALLPHF